MKSARTRLRLSQAALAERSGLASSYIAQIETERKFPSSSNLNAIADALHVRPYELLMEPGQSDNFDRQEVVVAIANEIRDEVADAIERVVEKYLGQAKRDE